MTKAEAQKIYPLVLEDIDNGASIKDVIQKYNISEYYAKKWTKTVYKNPKKAVCASHRFRWLIDDELLKLEVDIGQYIPETISNENWDLLCNCLKEHLRHLMFSIIEAN